MKKDLLQVIKTGYFDLHLHTTASDGIYSPRDLIKMAKAAGLKTIAITDHDTLEGIEEARQAGLEYGVNIIAGIELSTKFKGRNVDILGYYVTENKELTEHLSRMREGREKRALRMIEKFTELGMPFSLEDVKQFSKGNVIGRPHIAKAVVQKGYVSDYQTVFNEYLADGKPCTLDKLTLSVEEGIGHIHRAGGIAVLAHPKLLGDDEIVRELLKFPFDGIEVWHRKQNNDDNANYQQIANEFKLIMTGGSDFHNDEHSLGQFGFVWQTVNHVESKPINVVWQKTKIEKVDRNQLNGHKSFIIWLTGLSGAGKSTLAIEIEKELFQRSIRCVLLDGDNIRHGLNKNLSFKPEDRTENIRRIGEVSKLFVEAGMIAIVASISPYIADRAMVRSLVSEGDFIEVYVKCSIEECERRDPKGLYKKSRAGEIISFTGISAPYEPPINPEIKIETDKLSIMKGLEEVLQYLQVKGYLPPQGVGKANGSMDYD